MSIPKESIIGVGNSRVSRRKVLETAAKVVVVGGLATVGIGEVVVLATHPPKEPESLIGKDVGGKGVNEYITDPMGDHDHIILRSAPDASNGEVVGYTKPGFHFWAQAEYGTTYDSGQKEISNVQIGSDHYGIWYRGAGLPVFDELKMNDGKTTLVPRLDEQGNQIKSGTVHVAGNFLVKAHQESSK